jgi:hypothetical protein
MDNQFYETQPVNEFFDDNGSDKYEISELIQERAKSAQTFALISMIVSGALLFLVIGSFIFQLMMFSPLLSLLALPVTVISVILEIILMIGAIVMNIMALVNASKQSKELKLYNDGPDKDILSKTVKLGKIFTYIGVGVGALALVLIIPLNVLEFLVTFI